MRTPDPSPLLARRSGPDGGSAGEHPQLLDAVEHRRALVRDRMALAEAQAGEALEQQRDRDLRLGPRQRGAQAEMDASAEGEVIGLRPLDIEAIRFGVYRRIVPGAEQRCRDRGSLG